MEERRMKVSPCDEKGRDEDLAGSTNQTTPMQEERTKPSRRNARDESGRRSEDRPKRRGPYERTVFLSEETEMDSEWTVDGPFWSFGAMASDALTTTGAWDEADDDWTSEARLGSIVEEDEGRMQQERVLRGRNREKRKIRGWKSQGIQTKRGDTVPETSVRSDYL